MWDREEPLWICAMVPQHPSGMKPKDSSNSLARYPALKLQDGWVLHVELCNLKPTETNEHAWPGEDSSSAEDT